MSRAAKRVSASRVLEIRRLLGLGGHAVRIADDPAPGSDAARAGAVHVFLGGAFEVLSRFHAHCIVRGGVGSISADELVAVFGGFPELAGPLGDGETAADINHTLAATGLPDTHAAVCEYAYALATAAVRGVLPAWDGRQRVFPGEVSAQQAAAAAAALAAAASAGLCTNEQVRVWLMMGLPAGTRIVSAGDGSSDSPWRYTLAALEAVARLWALHALQGLGPADSSATTPMQVTAAAAASVLGGDAAVFARDRVHALLQLLIPNKERCLRALDARRDAIVAAANSAEHQQRAQQQLGLARHALPAWDGVHVVATAAPPPPPARPVPQRVGPQWAPAHGLKVVSSALLARAPAVLQAHGRGGITAATAMSAGAGRDAAKRGREEPRAGVVAAAPSAAEADAGHTVKRPRA